jgi:uncharacterized protein YkwD
MHAVCLALLVVAGAAGPPASGSGELSANERVLLRLLNEARAKENLPLLQPDPVLCRAARAHAARMARQGKLSHFLDGKSPKSRLLAVGYEAGAVGENLAFSAGEDDLPLGEVHAGWMRSGAERANILGKEFQEVGVGLARGAKGEVFYAEVFAARRKRS